MNNWHLYLCGISHRNSSQSLREPLQIQPDQLARANTCLSQIHGVREALILSTCNRIEFYFIAGSRYDPLAIVAKFYESFRQLRIDSILPQFYLKKDKHTADHLFRVAAGLDSMVIGENQIVSQLKDAYSSACAVKTAGKVIHRLFHQAFRTGKQVRTDTDMGKGACSVSSAAVELIREKLGELDGVKVLMIGVNQMVALAAEGMSAAGCSDFTFANRTPEKAALLAAKFGGEVCSLDTLTEALSRVDLVFTCTASSEPLVTDNTMDKIWKEVPFKRLTIVDIAIPRDTAITLGKFPGLEIFDLDAVKHFVETEQIKRKSAIPRAEEIIARKLEQFTYWFTHIRQEPIYNGLEDTFELIRKEESESLLERLPDNLREEFDAAFRRLTSRLLQIHIRAAQPSQKTE
ncbi:MAG: glutamyl-tRNA reductase [bacterium]|jgi:glutamyl-tRNA reductase